MISVHSIYPQKLYKSNCLTYTLEYLDSTVYHDIGESEEISRVLTLLGRDTSCHVRYDDSWSTVSGKHALIEKNGNRWRLVHLSKTNQTYVNGKSIQTPYILKNGDEIQLSANGPRVIFKNRKNIWRRFLYGGLVFVAFLVGLLIPSPLYRNYQGLVIEDDVEALIDTTNMVIDGGTYNGSIIKNSQVRNGYGRYETESGSVYEGHWINDRLIYGTRTTQSSTYSGHFNSDLNNDGFGIIKYNDEYIERKREQGLADSDITTKYIGNWYKNNKHGIGRSYKKDGRIEFGHYSNGEFRKVPKANYQVGSSVYGIDVSHFQKDINWNDLALYCDRNGNVHTKGAEERIYMQPVFFAYIKATEGATIRDEMFSVRMTEAERHGIVKGAYHFLRLGSSVESQLKNFLELATWTHGDLPPALDIEIEAEIKKYGVGKLQSMALEWLEGVESKMGVQPIIYTRENIRNKYLSDSKFKKYQFWIAKYSSKRPEKMDWQIWQQTEKGDINGYEGNIDINIFHGNYSSFIKFIGINEP